MINIETGNRGPSQVTQAAQHLGTVPARISELERGTRLNIPLANAYREYLNAA